VMIIELLMFGVLGLFVGLIWKHEILDNNHEAKRPIKVNRGRQGDHFLD